MLEQVLSGNTRLDVDRALSEPTHALSSHTLYLKLWTDRGEVALSMTASMIGPEHEAQRPVALYGQVLDHDFIAGLQGARTEVSSITDSGVDRRGEGGARRGSEGGSGSGSEATLGSESDARSAADERGLRPEESGR